MPFSADLDQQFPVLAEIWARALSVILSLGGDQIHPKALSFPLSHSLFDDLILLSEWHLHLYPFLGAELGLQSMDLLDVHCNGVLCSLGNDSTVGLTQFDESKGGGWGVGGEIVGK